MEARFGINCPKLLLSVVEQQKLTSLIANLREPQAELCDLETLFAELSKFVALMHSRVDKGNNNQPLTDSRVLLLNFLLAAPRKTTSTFSNLMAALKQLAYIHLPDIESLDTTADDVIKANKSINSVTENLVDTFDSFAKTELSARALADAVQLKQLLAIMAGLDNKQTLLIIDQVIHLQIMDIVNGLRAQRNFHRVTLLLTELDHIMSAILKTKNEDSTLLLLKYIQLTDQERDELITTLSSADRDKSLRAYQAFKQSELRTGRSDILTILSLEDKIEHLLSLISASTTPSVRILSEHIERHKLYTAINDLRSAKTLRTIKEQLMKCASVLASIESRVTNNKKTIKEINGYNLLMRYLSSSREERHALYASLHKLCCIADFSNPSAADAVQEQLDYFNNFNTHLPLTQKQKESLLFPYLTLMEEQYTAFQTILYTLCKSVNMKFLKEQIKICGALIDKSVDERNLTDIASHYLSIEATIEFINDLVTYVRSHPIVIKKSLEERLQYVQIAFDELSKQYEKYTEKSQLLSEARTIEAQKIKKTATSSSAPAIVTTKNQKDESSIASLASKLTSSTPTKSSFLGKSESQSSAILRMLTWRLIATHDLLQCDTFFTHYENQVCSIDENDLSSYLKNTSERLKQIKSVTEIRVFDASIKEWRKSNEKIFASLEATIPLISTLDKIMLVFEKKTAKKSTAPTDSNLSPEFHQMYATIKASHYTRMKTFLPTSDMHISHIEDVLKLPKQIKRRLKTIQLEKSTKPSAAPTLFQLRSNSRTFVLAKAGDIEISNQVEPKQKKVIIPLLAITTAPMSEYVTVPSPVKRQFAHKRLTEEERRNEMATHRTLSLAELTQTFYAQNISSNRSEDEKLDHRAWGYAPGSGTNRK